VIKQLVANAAIKNTSNEVSLLAELYRAILYSYISNITLGNSESAKLTSVPTNSIRNVTVPHMRAACMLY